MDLRNLRETAKFNRTEGDFSTLRVEREAGGMITIGYYFVSYMLITLNAKINQESFADIA